MKVKELKELWKNFLQTSPDVLPRLYDSNGRPNYIGDIMLAGNSPNSEVILYADNPWFEGTTVKNLREVYNALEKYEDGREVILGDENCELWHALTHPNNSALYLFCDPKGYIPLY
jgi:hypothetical protein